MTWFKEGDRNTKFFHAQVRGRRKRLQPKRIQNSGGTWIEEEQEIAEEAIKFYEEQFTEASTPSSFDIVEHVPNLINTKQNAELIKQPTKEEVKVAVFGLNGDSAGGPDGMTGKFYHSCWDLIGDDLYDMVRAFFNGHELPKFVTHTNLVLLPKKKEVNTFSNLRPISLSNFSNKVISRVVHERLLKFLPSLISEEHAGFVKGRNIVENILLTQEIVTDIRLRTKVGPNVILKLDMTKVYDRISWLFLTKVLRKMVFTERLIGIVFGLVSNNWYSILINGQTHGFFKSSRGIKQGDPVSPTLFILAAEALSRGLNALHTNLYFCGFGMPKWSPKINHLAYTNDMIIFSSSDETSLMLIMQVLKAYEDASGQIVNKTKSAVYLHHLTDMEVVSKVERITGIHRNDFPIIYLGCPIFYARRKLEFYQPLITKVMDKLQSWKGKLLSVGGMAVLISHVLQSMPMHLLSTVNPPKYVINRLHKLFAQFFWSSTVGGTSRHWASWNTSCMPVEEGGIGFRSLHDVAKALFNKLWWNFRTKPSLWSSFVCQKYCKKLNSIIVPWKRGSHIWKKMLECRDLIEHQILWQTKMGSSLFWYENWTGLGALYFLVPQDFGIDENIHNVHDVTLDSEWDVDRLFQILPEDLAVHILEKIKPPSTMQVLERPFWMLETRGYFSVKSAWEYTRRRDEPRIAYRKIWVKGLPFKIAFFMWKVWKAKLPLDDFLKRVGYCMSSKCWCCVQPDEESLQHMFFRSETAKTTWKYFLSRAGINVEGLTLHQAITKCWTANVCLRLKLVMQAIPSCVVWELWKRRNSMKYGEAVTTSRVIYQVSSNLQALVKVRKPGMDRVPHKWQNLLEVMENFTPKLKVTKVMWEFPSAGWLKVNTDGASRGNPGRSSIGFCIRNENGDIVKSVGKEIEETTNTVAEAKAMVEALRFCRFQQYSHVWLQTDSMLLKKIMDGIWKSPWIISEQVEEMMQLMNGGNSTVTHIHREGNKLADHLANYALDNGEIEYQQFWHLDAQGRRFVNEDKLQCPNLRVKVNRSATTMLMPLHAATFDITDAKEQKKHQQSSTTKKTNGMATQPAWGESVLLVHWIYNQHGAKVFNITRIVQLQIESGNIKLVTPHFEHNKKQMALETQLACAANMFFREKQIQVPERPSEGLQLIQRLPEISRLLDQSRYLIVSFSADRLYGDSSHGTAPVAWALDLRNFINSLGTAPVLPSPQMRSASTVLEPHLRSLAYVPQTAPATSFSLLRATPAGSSP
uniref:Uncharacterized protein n=1 Tax=Nicotiana tabacum TaxID=4097 RepID=A0A1S4D824_TOBAC|nr:PREDICTED: uncharacterized protein LOC107826922 [Nicotiana tabacum]